MRVPPLPSTIAFWLSRPTRICWWMATDPSLRSSNFAVETEKFEERKDGSVAIHQQILVGRDSQKAIVLGKGGTRIRALGEAARKELAGLLGRKVHLFLHVKVNPKWEEDRGLYLEIGLDWVE